MMGGGWFVVFVLFGLGMVQGEKKTADLFQSSPNHVDETEKFLSTSNHTNNWALIVDTSRWWYNYRHAANALAFYHTVKRLGIPDSNIILMLADDIACNPRNIFPGTVYNKGGNEQTNLYGTFVEVDYRDYEVTEENMIRLLVGRHSAGTPRSKRLLTDSGTNLVIYMTGHGGVDFIKFQDAGDISSQDLADAFSQMWLQRRYNEILFIVDTCQAATLYSAFDSPNIIAVGSSIIDQNSYSQGIEEDIGVSLADRFTDHSLNFFEKITSQSQETLGEWLETLTFNRLKSNIGVMAPYFARAPVPHNSETYDPLYTIKITDFLGFNSRVLPLDSLPSFSPSSFFSKGGGYFGGGDDSLEEREPETEEETEETKEKTYLFVEGDAEEGLGDGFCESIELEEYRSRPSFLNNEFVFGCAVLAGTALALSFFA
mmetsp:Transcript_43102/g.60442  ORF Transcript_43102/g.60442 Transcript_43102/m.60442 type:complete len:429 (+) Transcript_43102:630-1916(+)